MNLEKEIRSLIIDNAIEGYDHGFNDAIEKCAELVKKYDKRLDDIEKALETANVYLDVFWSED